MEKVLVDYILSNTTHITWIRPVNKKGVKERDHLFADESGKKIYYAELKANLMLDTEKCFSTATKVAQIIEELKQEYPDYEVCGVLVGLRYLEASELPTTLSNKYSLVRVVGINEYLAMFGVHIFGDAQVYNDMVNALARSMFT
jgi:hypothetical protein